MISFPSKECFRPLISILICLTAVGQSSSMRESVFAMLLSANGDHSKTIGEKVLLAVSVIISKIVSGRVSRKSSGAPRRTIGLGSRGFRLFGISHIVQIQRVFSRYLVLSIRVLAVFFNDMERLTPSFHLLGSQGFSLCYVFVIATFKSLFRTTSSKDLGKWAAIL